MCRNSLTVAILVGTLFFVPQAQARLYRNPEYPFTVRVPDAFRVCPGWQPGQTSFDHGPHIFLSREGDTRCNGDYDVKPGVDIFVSGNATDDTKTLDGLAKSSC